MVWCGVVWCGVETRDGRGSLLQEQLPFYFYFLVEKFQELVLFVCVVCV